MSIAHFELISTERLAKAFGVSVERAREAQDNLGYMYRQLASLPGENTKCCLGLTEEECGEVPLRHCDKVERT